MNAKQRQIQRMSLAMDLLRRVKRILRATFHDLMEKTEDPDLELAKFVEDCELALGELRAEVNDAQLRRDRYAHEAAGYRQTADEWMARARIFAAEDRKDAALDALRCRREAFEEARVAEEAVAECDSLLAALGGDAAALEEKLRNALQEQKRLSVQLRGAEADQRAGMVLGGPDRFTAIREKVQERIFSGQAAGDAGRQMFRDTPEARFRALEAPSSIEDELAELMKQMKKKR
jgi:phage shock protein A